MQPIKLFSFLLFVGSCTAIHMPKIFKDEMVLQASSTGNPIRTIWGFLDGVASRVELIGICDLPNGESLDVSEEFVPKPVSLTSHENRHSLN